MKRSVCYHFERKSTTGNGAHTHLLIATTMTTPPRLTGALTRIFAPLLAPTMQSIYHDEMRRLNDLAQTWPPPPNPTVSAPASAAQDTSQSW